MTALSNRVIGFAFGLLLSLSALPADAGFIPAMFEGEGVSAAPVGASFTKDEAPKLEARRSPLLPDLGNFALPREAPSTGAGSGVSSSAPVVFAIALAESAACSSQRIVTYLAEQPDLKIPVPFLDGVFRPPRA